MRGQGCGRRPPDGCGCLACWPALPPPRGDRPLKYVYVRRAASGSMVPALLAVDHEGTDGGDHVSVRGVEWVPEGFRR